MISPWKFLAQLMPERRSAKPPDSSIGRKRETEDQQDELQKSSDHSLKATVAPDGPELGQSRTTEPENWTSNPTESDIDVPPPVEVPDVEASDAPTPRQSGANTQSRAPRAEGKLTKTARRKIPAEKLKAAKRNRTEGIASPADAANMDQAAPVASPRESLFNDAAVLDREIKQLRILLGQKLQLQNDQLKRMLKRFDLS